jgi:hypothetical protein
MKKNPSIFLKGIKEGIILNVILFVSYIVCFILYPLIIAIAVKNGDFSDVPLFYEMWFINAVNIIVFSFLFIIPCLLGGIFSLFLIEVKRISNILIHFLISTLIYLFGLLFVILATREKFELLSYDLVAYILFLFFTILRWKVMECKRNK